MTVKFLRHDPHFAEEKESRNIYHIIIERGGKKMEFDFGQSLANSAPPARLGERQKRRIAPTIPYPFINPSVLLPLALISNILAFILHPENIVLLPLYYTIF